MSAKAKSKPIEGGTVLLRQARPKYDFQGRKLPKENSILSSHSTKHTPNVDSKTDSETIGHGQTAQSFVQSMNTSGKPVAVVGASYQVNASGASTALKAIATSTSSHLNSAVSMPNLSNSMPHRDGSIESKSKGQVPSIPSGGIPMSPAPSLKLSPNLKTLNVSTLSLDESEGDFEKEDENLVELTASSVIATQVLENAQQHHKHVRQLEWERDQARQELDVQLQVNAELKKLLVASVGEDLSQRVERLARDRAQLSMDLGGFSKKMSEDHENFDKVSIQADMWRSKYLASRVMVEELASARAYYALQSHDCQDALQQLLNERHELRTNLLENYKVLQQVKQAFDPLNSHRSSCLPSTNVLHLTRACQQLSEAVRFRLLPAHVAVPIQMNVGVGESWENSVTRAEQFAHEVLSRPSVPTSSLVSGSGTLLPLTNSSSCPSPHGHQICRFHPNARHENLTFNCCYKCKGDISVI